MIITSKYSQYEDVENNEEVKEEEEQLINKLEIMN